MADEKTLTPDQLEALGQKMEEIAGGQDETSKVLDELKTGYATISDNMDIELSKARHEITALKGILTVRHGASGAADWLNEMAKFISAVWHKGNGRVVPESLVLADGTKLEDLAVGEQGGQKAAADFTTGVTAPYAGYLLPEVLRPDIIPLKDAFGKLYPKLTNFTVPAGVNVRLPKDVASPVAVWRGTQVTAITEEATPMTFGRGTINTELLGSYIQISNELLANPAVNFGAIATVRLLRAILKGVETGVIQGDSSGTPPSDGFLVDTNVNDQGNIATATFANVVAFLQACLVDDATAHDTTGMTILIDPSSLMSLATEAVGAAELTGMLVWGDPRKGTPTTFLGYEVMSHPSMVMTNKHIALVDLSSVFLGEDAAFTVDINPYLESAFKENASWLRVFNHYDWELGQPGEMHYSTIGV